MVVEQADLLHKLFQQLIIVLGQVVRMPDRGYPPDIDFSKLSKLGCCMPVEKEHFRLGKYKFQFGFSVL
jgi:hypothetical protein